MQIGSSMRFKHVYSGTCLANKKFMQKIEKILSISSSQKAQYRVQVLEFHEKYGIQATKDAFGIGKTTIYRWRHAYLKEKKDASILIPKSQRPIHIRQAKTDQRIIAFIREMREEHRRIGKEKIKPLLDQYCEKNQISRVSEATIGRIIQRHHLFFQKKGRIYHDPQYNYKTKKRSYKSRVKHSPKVQTPGYVEIDSITRFSEGNHVYIIHGIDVCTRFSFSYAYPRLNSGNGKDFLVRFAQVYSFHTVQTDNGLEFHGEFDAYLQSNTIAHVFTYPRCPRINGFIERANRSLSEEFLEDHLLDMDSLADFNAALQEHMNWYNEHRIHRGLKNLTPCEFLKQFTS